MARTRQASMGSEKDAAAARTPERATPMSTRPRSASKEGGSAVRKSSAGSQKEAVSTPVPAPETPTRTLRSASKEPAATAATATTTPPPSSSRKKRTHSDAASATAEQPPSSATSSSSRRKRAESDVSMKSVGSKSSVTRDIIASPKEKRTPVKAKEATSPTSEHQDTGISIDAAVAKTPTPKKSDSSSKKKKKSASKIKDSPHQPVSPKESVSETKTKPRSEETEAEKQLRRLKRKEKRKKSKSKKSDQEPVASDEVDNKPKNKKETASKKSASEPTASDKVDNQPEKKKVKAYKSTVKEPAVPENFNDNKREKKQKKAAKKAKRESAASESENASNVRDEKKSPSKKPPQSPVVVSDKAKQVGDKKSPSVDVSVHRARYMNFHPKPILAIRATPPTTASGADYVAVSRDNGCVEIRSANEKLRVITTMAGSRNKPVTVMSWTCGCLAEKTQKTAPSLVGGCRDGSLFIIDAVSGSTRGMIDSGGGGVFSMVSLCHRRCCEGECCRLVAAGCEDGAIRIFQLSQDLDALDLVSTIPPVGGAVLSLAWTRQRTTPHESRIFAGVADGTIRRYDISSPSSTSLRFSGSSKPSVRMTVESLGRTTPTRVWALEALSDGTVISTDSLGHVQFWDGHSGTLQQSFDQNDNKADVLCLAVSADENMVFASGVDSRVVCIERPSSESVPASSAPKWMLTNAQRPHTHDVNALAIHRVRFPNQSSKEILTSGGIDTKISMYDTQNFQKSRPRVLYPWNANSICVAGEARMFVMLRENAIDVYALGKAPAKAQLPVAVPESSTLVGSIEISGMANLVGAAIADDAKFVALADLSAVYIFKLVLVDGVLLPEQVKTAFPQGVTAQAMCFHSNNQILVASSDENIYSVDLASGSCENAESLVDEGKGAPQLRRSRASSIHVSKCGTYVATVRCSMVGNYVDLFKKEDDGRLQYWWTLPPLEIGPSAVSFINGDHLRIAVCCSDFSVYVFDVAGRRVDKWSEAAGYPVASSLPIELRQRTEDYPVRLFSDPKCPQKLLMGSFGAFAVFDLDVPFPRDCITFPETHVRGKKRKRSSTMDETDDDQPKSSAICKLCLRYNSMLHLGYVGPDEMLVVEQPWLNVVATFPPALQRRVYGS